jgi:hypothetical protein
MGLRDEIIESQKARADLFKWKIILVAAIGAAVLGVGDPLGGSAASADSLVSKREYLLCLVPLVCVYTDILCAHMNLRIRVIGQFLRIHPLGAVTDDSAAQVAYENFAHKARNMAKPSPIGVLRDAWSELFDSTLDAYVFEDIALHASSMALSLFVAMWGFAIQWRFFPRTIGGAPAVFWVAGFLGAAATGWALFGYHRRVKALVLLAESEAKGALAPGRDR